MRVALVPEPRSIELRNTREFASGTVNFCSWERLARELAAAGHVRQGEEIAGFFIEDSGITICYRTR